MSNQILNRFDKLVPYYDKLAKLVFGSAIRKAQASHLNLIQPQANVLVLGGGTGNWLNDLVNNNPTCHVWYVEASSAMLRRAAINLQHSNQITFIHGTHNDIPDFTFDVVITYFFVDMFNNQELNMLVQQIKGLLKNDGLWLVSDFVEQKTWHKLLLWVMYLFFRLTRAVDAKALPAWDTVIQECSFLSISNDSFYGHFIHSRVYAVG